VTGKGGDSGAAKAIVELEVNRAGRVLPNERYQHRRGLEAPVHRQVEEAEVPNRGEPPLQRLDIVHTHNHILRDVGHQALHRGQMGDQSSFSLVVCEMARWANAQFACPPVDSRRASISHPHRAMAIGGGGHRES